MIRRKSATQLSVAADQNREASDKLQVTHGQDALQKLNKLLFQRSRDIDLP
jgi:hypothetical protein